MNQTKEVLTKARALIVNGWTQHYMRKHSAEGISYCMLGAIDEATGLFDAMLHYDTSVEGRAIYNAAMTNSYFAGNKVREAITDSLSGGDGSIQTFNDKKGRTKEEVLDLLDKTIASIPDEG